MAASKARGAAKEISAPEIWSCISCMKSTNAEGPNAEGRVSMVALERPTFCVTKSLTALQGASKRFMKVFEGFCWESAMCFPPTCMVVIPFALSRCRVISACASASALAPGLRMSVRPPSLFTTVRLAMRWSCPQKMMSNPGTRRAMASATLSPRGV